MFDEIENPIVISWDVVVRWYLEGDDRREAMFNFFFQMLSEAARPLKSTFYYACIACSRMLDLEGGYAFIARSRMLALEEGHNNMVHAVEYQLCYFFG